MPHSEIHGSKLIRSSPRLFAAYHVLLRLCMPRHPPNALTTLNRSHCQCSSFIGYGKPFLLACAQRGAISGNPDKPNMPGPKFGYLLQPNIHDAIDAFDPVPFNKTSRRAMSGPDLRPASRDNVRWCAVRQHQSSIRPEMTCIINNRTPFKTKLPSTPRISFVSGRLGHQRYHRSKVRTSRVKPKTPGSLQTYLLFTILQNRRSNPLIKAKGANLIFFKGYHRSHQHRSTGQPVELVELSGIEPLTPCLQSRCSPS